MSQPRVTVWNEYRHERNVPEIAAIYPEGIHRAIANYLRVEGFEVHTATLDEPQHGLIAERLARTDVLIWWGHIAHDEVSDEIVDRICQKVLVGMGLIVLHSGHFSKIFKRLMGTTCDLKFREAGEKERIWVVDPGHPITTGLGEYFEIPEAEMYGEFFDVPPPESLVFVSWFQGGDVFRSGCCYRRGQGKIFYFRPGHETFPIYHQPEVLKVISNAVHWAAPASDSQVSFGHRPDPIEPFNLT